jgi:hypothetical protein
VEASHHAGQHVDSERDPRAPDGLAALLVNHDDVDLGMVDLDDFQRSTGGVFARRCCHGPKRLGVFSAHRLDPLIDELQTRLDRSPGRRRPALAATGASNLLQYALERWPGRLEVFPFQNLADQRLLVRMEDTGSLRSPAARPTQAFDGPGPPVACDQAIEGCPADPEFPGNSFDHTDPQTLRIAVQEIADPRLPAASLIPTRLILVADIGHRRLPTLLQRVEAIFSY